jgi:galactan endo-1,6-beta-galactosidase
MGKAFGNRTDLADVLFGMNQTTFNGTVCPGLGLNFVRYNAGACGTGSVNGQSMVINSIPASRQIQGYWLNPTSSNPSSSSWNWSVDANQRAMLLNAKARGANRFELFSNSPMWWMLQNYNPAGSASGSSDNLSSSYSQQFAIYLATIAKYAQDNWGITFTTVDAFNEPVSSWWKATNNQEGCHFGNSSQPAIISNLRTELDSRGLNSLVISAADDNSFDQTVGTWNSYSTTTRSQVGQINSHGYQKLGGNQAGVYSAAVAAGKKLYNSEYGDSDASGMTMASVINYNLAVLHPTGWTYWQALDSSGWGMIDANVGGGTIGAVSSKYFVMAQYSRHIRPGMTIIDSGDANSVAAYDATAQKLVIVTSSVTAQTITYNLANYATVSGPITRWATVTGSGDKYVKHTDLSLSGKTFSATFAANSVQTFEIQNVSTSAVSTIADGTYKIINRNSGLALDVAASGTANGANVDQATYTGGDNQLWTVTNLGGDQYSIIGVGSGKSLDVTGSSTADGANIEIWTYSGSTNQTWTFAATSGGYYTITSVLSGKLLDVVGRSTASGANVDQWKSNGGNNQQWILQAP